MCLGTAKGTSEMVQAVEAQSSWRTFWEGRRARRLCAVRLLKTAATLEEQPGPCPPARASSAGLDVGASSARSPSVTETEYELDSKTATVLIYIKSHMLCCKNVHCACFRIELTLHTEYFSFI